MRAMQGTRRGRVEGWRGAMARLICWTRQGDNLSPAGVLNSQGPRISPDRQPLLLFPAVRSALLLGDILNVTLFLSNLCF